MHTNTNFVLSIILLLPEGDEMSEQTAQCQQSPAGKRV